MDGTDRVREIDGLDGRYFFAFKLIKQLQVIYREALFT